MGTKSGPPGAERAALSSQRPSGEAKAYGRTIDSICPICRANIRGRIHEDKTDGAIVLHKTCPEHGDFQDRIHSSREDYVWRQGFLKDGTAPPLRDATETKRGCPQDCGLCRRHINTPSIALIDVTNRCNLRCPICFAAADATGRVFEPPFEDIVRIMKHFRDIRPQPPMTLQLSGGEPTLREDLPRIVREGVKLGFQHIMVNTNGLKMTDIEYCRELARAGVNAVYLQFDGLEPRTYERTRGVDLVEKKLRVQVKKGVATTLLTRLIRSPGYPTVESFMFGPSVMIGCMHFQDAYNLDTERVRRCLVHYGVYHPGLNKVLEIPFCTYNTLHRERIENELSVIRPGTRSAAPAISAP